MVFTAVYRTTDWRGVCVSTDRVRPHGLRPVQLFGGDSFSRHHWWIDSSVNSSVEFILWHVLTVWCRVYFTGEYQMKVRRQCGFLKGTDCNYTHSQTLRPRLRPGLPPSDCLRQWEKCWIGVTDWKPLKNSFANILTCHAGALVTVLCAVFRCLLVCLFLILSELLNIACILANE